MSSDVFIFNNSGSVECGFVVLIVSLFACAAILGVVAVHRPSLAFKSTCSPKESMELLW